MADYNFNVDLDFSKISTRYFIENIETVLKEAMEEGLLDLGVQIEDKLIDNLIKYDLLDTDLANTINVQVTEDSISISMGSDYAVFIEYGTGIVGSENPHPNPKMNGWIYDVNSHGEKGWFYPTTESDPNPYKHIYNGQLYGWTKGLPSRPFMYDTWLWGVRSANNIVNKHINKALRKLEGDYR